MDPRVVLVPEEERGRRREMARSHSWSVARSGISVGDVRADASFDVTELPDRMLVWPDVDLDRKVDLVDVDEALAECGAWPG